MHVLKHRACRDGPERGQTMAEYAVVLSIIIVGCIATLTAFQSQVQTGIDRVASLIGSL